MVMIRDKSHEVYTRLISFKDKNGDMKMGAATMFAATEARSCFPCFDEPDFKVG